MRAGPGGGCREGRRARGADSRHRAPRAAAGGNDGPHPGIRRAGRHWHDRDAQRALARAGQEDGGGVVFNDKITLPYEPFIGTLGVSPEIEAISSLTPDYYGGNMDLPDVAPGAIVYFPVQHEGGYLYVGDCHGTQGDGELCGVAVEIASTTTLHVDLIKGWPIAWPRLENDRFIMSIGSARPMEDAARIAYRDLVRWLVADYGFEESEAYFLLTQAGRVRLGNLVDPKYTLGASILKTYLG
jgi:amidase